MYDNNRLGMFPGFLTAFQGHSLILTDVEGRVESGAEGYYFHRTRFLSRLALEVNGKQPAFVSANPVDSYSFISYFLAPSPAGKLAGPEGDPNPSGGEVVEKGIEIQLDYFVGDGLHADVTLTNHALCGTTIELAWDLAADFRDQDLAGCRARPDDGRVSREWNAAANELVFRYEHPELAHATRVRFEDVPGSLTDREGKVVIRLDLAPREPVQFCISLFPCFCGQQSAPIYDCQSFRSHGTSWDQARDRWRSESAQLSTPNRLVQTTWDRSVYDLGSLFLFSGKGAEIYTPAAGVPMYMALFGRDSITTAWQAALLNPLMLKGTLMTMARWQGTRYDDRYDEQPGRILHQHQRDPQALLGKTPYLHYWGDYAAPGMFLVGAAWYFAFTGDKEFLRQLELPILRTLAWMDRDGDPDHDGFYEYYTRAGKQGTKNQGWKDSEQAILYPDGRFVPNPLAVVEIQGYYYIAKQLMGLTFMALGAIDRGITLLQQAEELKRRFNQAFWMPEEGFFALALDRDKQQVKSIASNVGHCLACGIVDADKAAAVAGRLMAPDMFSGWGIRTLSSEHPAYNPFSYHLGSVWPSENASIAYGFKRYGFNGLVHDLAKGIFEASGIFTDNRLPEVIGGHQRDRRHPHPGIYPQANAPQAWSASATIMLVQTMLGLLPIAPLNTLVLDPDLPDWLPELTLRDLKLGSSIVSVRFSRDAQGHTHHEVIGSEGRPRVIRLPMSRLTVGLPDLLGDLAEFLP